MGLLQRIAGVLVAATMMAAVGCGSEGDGVSSTTAKVGEVNVYFVPASLTGEDGAGGVAAFFFDVSGLPECSTRMVAGCSVARCPSAAPRGILTPVSAGTITVAGGSGDPMLLDPGRDNGYDFEDWKPGRFQAGDRVTVIASGGDVPAFRGEVRLIRGMERQLPSTFKFEIDRGRELALDWPAVTGDATVDVEIVQMAVPETISLVCSLPVAGGKGRVPAAALRELETTSGGAPITTVSLKALARTPVKSGDYVINLVSDVVLGSADANVR